MVSGPLSLARISFHEETVYQFHLQFDHAVCENSYKNKKIRPTERKELIYILRNTIFQQTITCLFLFCVSSSLLRIISSKHYSSLINVSPTKCTCSQFYYSIIMYHFLLHVWALLGHYHRELNRRGKVHKALVCIIRKCSFFICKTATSVCVCVCIHIINMIKT